MKKYIKYLLFASLLFSVSTEPSISIRAGSNGESWGEVRLKDSYSINESVYLSEISLIVNGYSVAAKPTLTFPSGRTTDVQSVLLNESGLYTVTYSSTIGGKYYEKTHKFFVETPYYSHGEKSSAHFGVGEKATHEGLVVSLAKNETLDFNEVIDLTNITKTDELFKFYLTPSTLGAYDFNNLIFKLTDIEDDTNYFEVTLGKQSWRPDVYQGVGSVFGKGDDCDRVSAESWTNSSTPNGGGSAKGYINANSNFGASINVSFNGLRRIITKQNYGERADGSYGWISNDYDIISTADYDATEAIIAYDYNTMELGAYSMNLDFKGCRTTENTYKKVWDFDDPLLVNKVVGGSGTWRGFTSGKCRLSIRAEQYESNYANFVLTKVYGIDLTQKILNDNVGPEISIDTQLDNDGNAKIQGKAGCFYPIPSASAVDLYCGTTPVKTNVYLNYGTNKQINVDTDRNRFYPSVKGTYTIEYSSSDFSNNKTVKTLNVLIGEPSVSDIVISSLSDVSNVVVKQGKYYYLPETSISGGIGEKNITAYATNGNERVAIIDNMFMPEETGTWTINIQCSDYIGQTGLLSYPLFVEENNEPFILQDPALPRYLLSNGEYEVPNVEAYQYASSNKVQITPTVKVQMAKKTSSGVENVESILNVGEKFSTDNLVDGGTASIIYEYNGVELASYEIKQINPIYYDESIYFDAIDFSKYFISNSVKEISYNFDNPQNEGYRFISNGSDMNVDFANQLLSDGINLTFAVEKLDSFDSIDVQLVDASDRSNKISLSVALNAQRSFNCTQNTQSKTTKLSLTEDINLLSIGFNGKSFVVGDNDVILPISTWDNGKTFDGFSTHKVDLSFALNGFADNSYITLKKIGNHDFTSNVDYAGNKTGPKSDYVEPQTYIEGECGRYGSLNELCVTDKIYYQDVFAPTSKAIVSVYNSNNTPVTSLDGTTLSKADASKQYEFKLTEVGYLTEDFRVSEMYSGDKYWISENTKTAKYTYGVVDTTKPIITLTSLMHTSTVVGGTLSLTTFTVSDNNTPTDKLIVIREMILPSGRFQELGNNITKYQFNNVGQYEFRIVVIDEAQNVSTYSTYIMVYEK